MFSKADHSTCVSAVIALFRSAGKNGGYKKKIFQSDNISRRFGTKGVNRTMNSQTHMRHSCLFVSDKVKLK